MSDAEIVEHALRRTAIDVCHWDIRLEHVLKLIADNIERLKRESQRNE